MERSYRALLHVPGLGRILVSMQLARIAQSMVGVALVLFTLDEYRSPALTGIVTAASVLPGLLVAPIAGALLDRHGRTRLVILDYAVALLSLALIGGLALAHALPVPVLLAITIVSSLTAILSNTGLRSLFPLLVPERLWERVNAIDSNGYLLATIVGPPAAAALVSLVGGATTIILIGLVYGGATLAMIGAPDPDTSSSSTGSLLADAWAGLGYTVRNPTLRGLGVSMSLLNLSGGMVTIVVPLIVLDRLHAPEVAVGLVFAGSGVAGMVAALFVGRLDSRGREWDLLVLPMTGIAVADLVLVAGANAPTAAVGLTLVGGALALERAAERPDGHRPVHDASAAHRPGLDGSRVRRVDGLQLHRLPDRHGARRSSGRHLDRGGDRRRRHCLRRRGGCGRRDDPASGPAGASSGGAAQLPAGTIVMLLAEPSPRPGPPPLATGALLAPGLP